MPKRYDNTHRYVEDDYAPYKLKANIETEDGVQWGSWTRRHTRIEFGNTTGFLMGGIIKNPDNGLKYRVKISVALMQDQTDEAAEESLAWFETNRKLAARPKKGKRDAA